jgi:hypothetical protein
VNDVVITAVLRTAVGKFNGVHREGTGSALDSAMR